MKILHTADWHIGQFKGPVVDGVNLRLQDTVKCLEYMVETIRDRYSDVKIMAITHDDAMKARFGQAVTVIKTDDGSKVIY